MIFDEDSLPFAYLISVSISCCLLSPIPKPTCRLICPSTLVIIPRNITEQSMAHTIQHVTMAHVSLWSILRMLFLTSKYFRWYSTWWGQTWRIEVLVESTQSSPFCYDSSYIPSSSPLLSSICQPKIQFDYSLLFSVYYINFNIFLLVLLSEIFA